MHMYMYNITQMPSEEALREAAKGLYRSLHWRSTYRFLVTDSELSPWAPYVFLHKGGLYIRAGAALSQASDPSQVRITTY